MWIWQRESLSFFVSVQNGQKMIAETNDKLAELEAAKYNAEKEYFSKTMELLRAGRIRLEEK